ncbi:MAG: hypothetical protein QOI66_4975 [Myxococcales bacterium]|jgi:hypothetical protein|nr:hypothetical protein [Myxococcales bacterium]
MKLFLIVASAALAIFTAGCQVDEGPVVGGGGGAGAAPGDSTDAGASDPNNGDADNASGTGGATSTGGTGGTSGGGGAGADADGGGTGGIIAIADGGNTGPSVCDGTGTRILTADKTKVDNFEGAALDPGWSTFSDVVSRPNVAKMIIQSGGAVGTAHAGHYAGMGARTPAMGGYGVGAVFNLAIDKTRGIYCVDISLFDGVTFWAKANRASGPSKTNKLSVNFVLPETNALSVGGDCPDASMKCYDHPRTTVILTTDWAQYTVTFAEASGGSATVANRIQELAFLGLDSDWDYWIDEIQLYKGTPPTGPVVNN